MSHESQPSGISPSPQETLEVFAYLACMGPSAFEPATARRLIGGTAPDATLPPSVDRVTDAANRATVSGEVGLVLAGVLSERARVSSLDLGAILPAMVNVDIVHGFTVLRELTTAATPALAEPLGNILLNLVVSKHPDPAGNGDDLARQAYLIDAVTALPLDSTARTRMFLALSQTLASPDLVNAVVMSDLFPDRPEDAIAILEEGNDDALRTMLHGALVRKDGREAFLATCRAVVDLGPARGIPLLARLDPLLRKDETGLRALESSVRATVLGAVERALSRNRHEPTWMPNAPDARTLRLLSLISPGLREPGRTVVCDWILDRAADRMHHETETATLVEALVGAALMHEAPMVAGTKVRRALLETAGTLRLRIVAVGTPTAEDLARALAFERFAGLLGNEFRRRNALANVLEGVLPYLTDLKRVPTDEIQLALTDDLVPAS